MTPNPAVPLEIRDTAARLFAENQHANAARCDRVFAVLFVVQWIAGIIAAVVISPYTWYGASNSVHPHLWAAIGLGAAIISFPIFLVLTRPGTVLTRQCIAVAQMLSSALLIHLSGGRIETHFHVFGSLAFLAFYRDWRVLVTATVVIALDHMLRGMFWSQSVFGIINASQWRWIEHACWVVFEDIILFMSCVRGHREMQEISLRQAELLESNTRIESEVAFRTAELRDSQAELRAAKDAAEGASTAKSEFLANMSHEIRTPMTAILGYADLLLEPQQNSSERLNGVQVIRRNGQHLLNVINDILDISKIEAGRMSVERIECHPPQLLGEVASLMGARASEKKLDLLLEFENGIPQTIQSDPTRLRQILLNLVGNAIKFTQQGTVKIVARTITRPGAPNPLLQFEVSDTGMGMDDQQIGALFRPFVQADNSMARKFGGTGLGLSISKRLAEMLGGDVTVSSKPGAGSTFTVTIDPGSIEGAKLVRQPYLLSEAENWQSPGTAAAAEKVRQLEGMRILLAEDGIDNQRLIGHIIRSAGADVTIVENGRLAYDAAMKSVGEQTPFDTILMDMQMPEMDGYAATSKLRQRGFQGVIIALTAHAMDSDRAKCINAGCDDYATKPIDRKKLIALVAQYRQLKLSGNAA